MPHEHRVVSAHRTPDLLFDYASSAEGRGLQVLIAGAGGAAHLPGMAAAKTALPVLGVPVESKTLKGMDSLLSIVQMPAGVPVGTLAIGRAGAVNAALLAAAIVAQDGRGGAGEARALPGGADRVRARRARPDLATVCYLAIVGVIGGGQLGRMLGLAGIPLGLSFRFLDPASDAPAGEVGELLVGAYDDPQLLDRLADGVDAVTYEFENVPVEAARRVGAVPAAAALEAAQDRLVEKQLFRRLGIPTARIDDEVETFPALLKTRRLGYDGKGQRLVESRPAPDPGHVLEELVPFDRELSLLAVRGRGRKDAVLSARRERPRGRASSAARAHRPPTGRRHSPRSTAPASSTSWTTSACSRSSSSRRAESSSPTSSPRASTTPATGRSRALRRASSRTICAPSSGCRSAPPRCAARSRC